MKTIAFLEYCFIFEPDNTFSNIYDFENILSDVFKSKGYQATVVDAIKGYTGRRVIYITKIENMLDNPKLAGETVPTPQGGKKIKL